MLSNHLHRVLQALLVSAESPPEFIRKELIKGLKFVSEPPVLRFFLGKLEALDNWGRKFCDAFKKDFGGAW